MKDERPSITSRRGYLNEEFLFFHLNDRKGEQYELHYHDFYKIVVFISGKVTYFIEGRSYSLRPWDILLVTNRDIHKAVIDSGVNYERMVIWFKPAFLSRNSRPGSDLLSCFDRASAEKQSLLRFAPGELKNIKNNLEELETAFKSTQFGADIIKNSLFLIFAVNLNRLSMRKKTAPMYNAGYDETISKIVGYIDGHTGSDLSIESLSDMFYMSRYTLMHKFKQQTGYTIHSFILKKRLISAGDLIRKGCPAMEAGYSCGFSDYSSFVRAFKAYYGISPGKYKKEK